MVMMQAKVGKFTKGGIKHGFFGEAGNESWEGFEHKSIGKVMGEIGFCADFLPFCQCLRWM